MRAFVTMMLALTLTVGSLSAQESPTKTTKLLPSTQAVLNKVVNNPDIMVITGRIVDATTHQPINDAKINFDKFGDELVNAAIDHDGNYALSLNKKEIGETLRIIFKIDGYQRYIAKAVKTNKSVVDLDLYLSPDDSKEASNARVTYSLGSDAFNTLVIKF